MSNHPDYLASVTLAIRASQADVWAALTKPELVEQYMHGAKLVTDWTVGNDVTWSGVWDGKAYQDRGTVLKCEPPIVLQYSHWSPLSGSVNQPENYHVVTFTLAKMATTTQLSLTQSNNPSQSAADAMAKNGWLPMLQALKTLLEK